MKSPEQIKSKIELVGAVLDTNISLKNRELVDVILEVLGEEMESEEIEERYFDENKTDRESIAIKTRQWLDDEITDEEFDEAIKEALKLI